MANRPYKGRGHVANLSFLSPPNRIFWATEAIGLSDSVYTCYIKLLFCQWQSPPDGGGQDHVTRFYILHPLKYLWNG